MMTQDVYSHGVGSACRGEEYHHEVYHLVSNGVTLCGVRVKGRHWWKVFPLNFIHEERRYIHEGDAIICKKCANIKAANERNDYVIR